MSDRDHEYMKPADDHFFLPELHHDDDEVAVTSVGWRKKLTTFLSSGKVSIVLSSLLLLDLAAVVGEILIQAHKHCETDVTCAGDEPPDSGGHRLLSESDAGAGAGDNATVFGLLPGCQLHLTEALTHGLHEAEQVLRIISIVVLFIFAFELLLVWLGMGMKFLRTPILVLDFVVVYVSLVVDLTFHNSALAELLVLLIITRLWRFVRIFHALGMTVHEVDEKIHGHEIHELKDQLAKEKLFDEAKNEARDEATMIHRKVTLLKKAKEHMNQDDNVMMPKVNCAEHAKTAAPWRTNLVTFLSSHTVSVVLSVMLLLDLVVVVTEIVLATFAECHAVVTCGDDDSSGAAGSAHRMLSEAAADLAHNVTGLVAGCEIEAEMELSHTLEEIEHVLRFFSLAVLFLFAIELLLLMCGMGPRFFKHPLLVLDMIVVYSSLALDFAYNANNSFFTEVIVLLFITRMWRFIRIFHALGMTVHEVDEAAFEKEKHHLEEEIQKARSTHEPELDKANVNESTAEPENTTHELELDKANVNESTAEPEK